MLKHFKLVKYGLHKLIIIILGLTIFLAYSQKDTFLCLAYVESCEQFLLDKTNFENSKNIKTEYISFAASLFSSYISVTVVLFSSIITIIVALFVFQAVTSRQIIIFEQNKELARTNLLNTYERNILDLFERKVGAKALEKPNETDLLFNEVAYEEPKDFTNFRWMLNENRWDITDNEISTLTDLHREIDGSNMVLIRSDGMRISSLALHETVMWFRNIYRAYEQGFLKDEDLAILWRQILPFTLSGRYKFFRFYFCKMDTCSFETVCVNTYNILDRKKCFELPENFGNNFDDDFMQDVKTSNSKKKRNLGQRVYDWFSRSG